MIERVTGASDSGTIELIQDDTHYCTASRTGLLKLRMLSWAEGQLIHYRRRETIEPGIWMSRYFIYRTGNPAVLGRLLERALGRRGRVIKRRLLYHIGKAQIHIDDVKDMGWFLVLEEVPSAADSEETGLMQVLKVMDRLGISAKIRSRWATWVSHGSDEAVERSAT